MNCSDRIKECQNWPNSQMSQCTCSISHNAPFRIEMCTLLFWMVHCGVQNTCIWLPFRWLAPIGNGHNSCCHWFQFPLNFKRMKRHPIAYLWGWDTEIWGVLVNWKCDLWSVLCLHYCGAVINSVDPCDAIWWHKAWSTMVQVMACGLMAPSHTWTNVDLPSVISVIFTWGQFHCNISFIRICFKITCI